MQRIKSGWMFSFLTFAIILSGFMLTGPAYAWDDPPLNPYLGDSPWPQGGHRNNYRQASTPLRGPEAGDTLVVDSVAIPKGWLVGSGTSPWLSLGHEYSDGSRAIWGRIWCTFLKDF